MDQFDGEDNGRNGSMMYPGPTPYSGDSWLSMIWRGRWLILASVAAGLAGAWFYLQKATPLYESASQILVDRPGPRLREEGLQPVGSTSNNYLQTQANMITSGEIIALALRDDPNVLTLPTLQNTDYPLEAVIRTLYASVRKNSDIITIRAESAYPDDAAKLVNAVVHAYIRWHGANRQLTTADLLKDLNSQLEKRYQDLRAKRKERMMFEQRNPEVLESIGGGLVSKTLEVLRKDLATTRLETTQQDSFYEGLKRFEAEPEALRQYLYSRRGSLAVPPDEGERSRLTQELLATQLQLEGFSTGGETPHPLLARLQNRQTQLQTRIAEADKAFVQKQISLAQALAEDAHTREKQLADLYEKELAKVQNLGGRDAQYAFIVSECEMLQSLCDSLLKQTGALDLSTSFHGLNIHVLEKAVPALQPFAPQATKTILIGVVLGLMGGAGLAFLRDWRNPRVRSAEQIAALLGVHVLGAVPSMSERKFVARGQRLQLAAGSREAEAYRIIRTALLCRLPREQTTTILVTSPGRSEGKTTLVSNLGVAMAQAGQRTLVVDADLRSPMQHRMFAENGHKHGLADVLAGTATLDETIRPTGISGLDVLASEQSAPNSAELLGGAGLSRTLDQLKGKYDCILVDSPPIGEVADAQILAVYCSLTLLVLRAERSSRMATQRAREALLTVGARLAGVVVNDISRKNNRYSQYHYHSNLYHYFYGDHSPDEGMGTNREPSMNVNLRPNSVLR